MRLPKETAMSPRAMTILDLMEGSLLVSRILRRSKRCPSQYCPDTHISFVSASVAAKRSDGDFGESARGSMLPRWRLTRYRRGVAQIPATNGPYTLSRLFSPYSSSRSRILAIRSPISSSAFPATASKSFEAAVASLSLSAAFSTHQI